MLKNYVMLSLVVVRFGEKSQNLPKNEFLGLPLHKIPAVHPPFLLRGGLLNKYYRGKKIRGNQMSEFYIIKHAIATNFY